MASLRKKYQPQFGSSSKDDGPPVLSPPQGGAARPPDPVADAKPPEPMVESDPVRTAEQSALKARLAEMERAEQIARQPQQQPQHASEPQQQQPALPAHVQDWLSRHPQYTDPNDQIAQAEIYTATLKCSRDGKDWNDDDFIPHLERHLGLAPSGNGHVESKPPPSAPRNVEPRQQARMSVPVSAPPTRQVPSMRTGRAPTYRAPLTADEAEIARASGLTAEQYQMQKERMLRMKAAGEMT